MEYLHYFSAGDLFRLASPMLATSVLGAVSQKRWRRVGPVVVASVVILAAFAWSSGVSRLSGHPHQPAVQLVFAGLGSACAGLVLIALGRLPIGVRLAGGLATGALGTLVAPIAAVVVACGAYSMCP
jgi:hypothetical protein